MVERGGSKAGWGMDWHKSGAGLGRGGCPWGRGYGPGGVSKTVGAGLCSAELWL